MQVLAEMCPLEIWVHLNVADTLKQNIKAQIWTEHILSKFINFNLCNTCKSL